MSTLWRNRFHSSHRHFLLALILIALFLLFIPRLARPEDGGESTFVSETGQQSADIRVSPLERKVWVHVVNKEKSGLPKSIGITLRSPKGESYNLELSAIEGARYGYYAGLIPAQQDSFVAAELRIPFGKKVVRLEPRH